MADVRALLKNERTARRIQHKHASYSATGTLLCTVCHLQLKSESLWEGHLRSAGHIMRAQKLQVAPPPPEAPKTKKRKASGDDEEDTTRKRPKPMNGFLPEGFFDKDSSGTALAVQPIEMQIPSRPATPAKPTDTAFKLPEAPAPAPTSAPAPAPAPTAEVDEDEWAAFEADIAAAEAPVNNEVVISAPAMTAEEIKKKSAEEEYAARKERQEAEIEGDKEDAARKMEEELEEMESLEMRVKRLREKREELRRKESAAVLQEPTIPAKAEEDEEDSEEDDEWDGFRMRG